MPSCTLATTNAGSVDAAEIERDDRGAIEMGDSSLDEAGEQQRDHRGHRKRHPAAAEHEAAQQIVRVLDAILRR